MKKSVTILLSLVSLVFLGNCQKYENQPGAAVQNEAQADKYQANRDQAPKKNTTVRKDDDPDNVKDAFKKAGREIKEFFVGKDTNDVDDDD